MYIHMCCVCICMYLAKKERQTNRNTENKKDKRERSSVKSDHGLPQASTLGAEQL